MGIRSELDCYIPVIQNQTEHLIQNLLFNTTVPSTCWFTEEKTFSLSRIEYIEIDVNLENTSILLGRTLFSTASTARAVIKDVFTCGDRLLLQLDYSTAETFQNTENLITLIETGGQTEIPVRCIRSYFRRPKAIISNTFLANRLKLLRFNPNYSIIQYRDSSYEFANLIVVIQNLVSKNKEIYFTQEDNQIAVII